MSLRTLLHGAAMVLAAAMIAAPAAAQTSDHSHHRTETQPFRPAEAAAAPWYAPEPDGTAPPPLFDTLGTVSFAVSTASPEAQRYFNQGLRLAYAFNHAEALRAFRAAQRLDPGCAMAYWGEALVLGPNINAPMEPGAVPVAREAAERALTLAARASDREQALIQALIHRYGGDPRADRRVLDAAYADGMARAAAQFPGDPDINVLFAEALMDLQPWDYWTDGGRTPRGRAGLAIETLERVLAAHPDHPGAIHYYIHLVEASDRPERAERHAERLAALMPGAGHIVHMPFHIYYRVGRYRDAVAANRAAVAADQAYLAGDHAGGIYPSTYYPHNVHSLMNSAQMAGDGASAIAAAEQLPRLISMDLVHAAAPFVQPILQGPYFAHAQFSTPEVILALPAPDDGLPFVMAAWHYARGVARAAQGDAAAAAAEADAIGRLAASGDFAELTGPGVPVRGILGVAEQVVRGRAAAAAGDLPAARAAFTRAVALQDGLGYMEPPYWYYPVRQSLGAVLLRMGDTTAAAEVFRAALQRAPNNGWALFGLAESQRAQGDADAAAETLRRLDQAWAGDRTALTLERL